MNVTINQIRQEMTILVQAHEMVNSFFWGDFHRAYNEKEQFYPLVCSYLSDGAINPNLTQMQLVVIVCDKTFKGFENLNDTESDTLTVARHLYNVIKQSPRWNALLRVNSSTFTKFYENTSDEVAGVILTMNIDLKQSRSLCDLPLDNYDFEGTFVDDGCDPVLIVNSNQSFSFNAPSGTIVELGDTPVLVVDQDGNPLANESLPSVTGGTIEVNVTPPTCDPATFEINGVEVATIPSGETDSIQVLQGGLEVGSLVGDNWVVPVCAPATIQLTSPSGVLQTVTGASGSTTSQTLRTIGRMPYRTGSSGASTPPVAGVDGLTQRGRNFLTLDYNNAWGNTNRFTWKNGTQVYPNGVTAEGNGYAVDNSTWDRNGKVLLIAYVTTTRTFANQATTALATTIDGLSGWEMINAEELSEITTGNSVANKQVNYAPFNIPEGTIIITSTEALNNNTQCLTLTTSGVEGSISKAGLRHTFFVRLATLTIDSLGNVTIS
jgi:hypothetical protein